MVRKVRAVLYAVLALGLLAAGSATAQIDYAFSAGSGSKATGSRVNLNFTHRSGTQWGSSFEQRLVNIGFTFHYDGNDYTQVNIYHSGVMTLGNNSLGGPTSNNLNNVNVPILAPFWDVMRITDNLQWQYTSCDPSSIGYMVTGSAPNRVFVADWDQIGLGQGGTGYRAPATFQIRLYEGSNKIEFYYEDMDGTSDGCSQWTSGTQQTSGTIGIGSSRGFISVSPGSETRSSSENSDNNVNLAGSPISAGTVYTFCPAFLRGDIAEGGTNSMRDGDTLLIGKQVVLSSSEGFKPFTLGSICASSFSYAISGPAAADYSISPANGSLPLDGNTPTLTFSPRDIGIRYAILTVRDNLNYVSRIYTLAGEGVPRVQWITDIDEGGSANLASGDTLMKNIFVRSRESEVFTPITLFVGGTSGPNAQITYELIDPMRQFSINKTSESIPVGSNSTLEITFQPTGVGPQTATLIVNAEGETRTFILNPFARGAGARFFLNNAPFGPGSPVFRNVSACVALEVETEEIVVESIGDEPFEIQTNDAFLTDNEIGPGTPPFPLLRDDFGNLIPVTDYFISDAPGSKVPIDLPVTIAPGERATIYLNFLPQRAGKRQARAFFQTNGVNFFGLDTDRNSVLGLLNFELVGIGLGSDLTDRTGEGRPKALVFPPTEVRETSLLTGYMRNFGNCDLLIDAGDFSLVSGDVADFKITALPTSATNPEGKFVLAPGALDSFRVAFSPVRSGSRRASLRLRTNDSVLFTNGFAERGTYYLDVFGAGKVGLEGRPVVLRPAVIDGEASAGAALIENSSTEVVTITDIQIIDPNGEFTPDPAHAWPILPYRIDPGSTVDLGVLFTPLPGSAPGTRAATIEVTMSNGDVLTIDVSGIAGTRHLSVAPTALFQGVMVPSGSVTRQFVAVSNRGTFPVTIQELRLTEAIAGDYQVAPLRHTVLQPGQFDFYEVTYAPLNAGMSSGTLEIVGNATNGPHVVTLGGEATSAALNGNPQGTTAPGTGIPAIRPVVNVKMSNGTTLWQSMPNPSNGRVEIRFFNAEQSDVQLALYSSNGELVRSLYSGFAGVGEEVVRADLGNIASGRYYYTLTTSTGSVTLALDIVK